MVGVVRNENKGTWNYVYFYAPKKRTSILLGKLSELTRDEAEARAREFLEQEKQKTVTVSVIIAQYRKTGMPAGDAARRNYDWLLKKIEEEFGPAPMATLIAGVVEDWIKKLKRRDGRDLAPGSKREIRGQFKRLWEFAIKRELVPGVNQFSANPIRNVDVENATLVLTETEPLTVEIFLALVGKLRRPYLTIFVVGIIHGLRIAELLGLQIQDIDMLRGKLHVVRRFYRGKEGKTKTKGSKKKDIPLKARTIRELQAWFNETPYREPENYVFASLASRGKKPVSANAVAENFRKAGEAVGLARTNSHVMRHTHRFWLALKKIPLEVQQESMRHDNIQNTLRYAKGKMSEAAGDAQGLVADMLWEAIDQMDHNQGRVQ